jgi:hypothetical protein
VRWCPELDARPSSSAASFAGQHHARARISAELAHVGEEVLLGSTPFSDCSVAFTMHMNRMSVSFKVRVSVCLPPQSRRTGPGAIDTIAQILENFDATSAAGANVRRVPRSHALHDPSGRT